MNIIEKPWGYEIIWADVFGKYLAKELYINKDNRLSLQYHEFKHETIRVIKGDLTLVLHDTNGEEIERELVPGDVFDCPPGTVHRFCAKKNDVRLMEVSTHNPDDVVRLTDDYDRTIT